MTRLLRVAVAIALAVSLVAGCGGGGSPSPAGATFPTGKWAGTAGDIPYVMEFRSDGTWTITWRDPDNQEQTNEGTYTADEDTVTFVTDAICDEQGYEDDGTYNWNYANDRLMLTREKDLCPDRIGALDLEAMKPAE